MQESAKANTSASRARTPPILDRVRRGYTLFKDSTLRFHTLRLTVHNAPVWENVASSEEQVSTLLLLEHGGAIEITMQHAPYDPHGYIVWKHVTYEELPGEKKHFDYALKTPVEIKAICHAIYYEWGSPLYLLTEDGKGSYYWNYDLLIMIAKAENDEFQFQNSDVKTQALRDHARLFGQRALYGGTYKTGMEDFQ